MKRKNKQSKKARKLNWWTITNFYRKETVIFYVLTTLSCLGSYLISSNSFKSVYDTLKKGEGFDDFRLRWDFSFFNLGEWQFGEKWKGFLLVMALLIIVYCMIVVAHVYYGYYWQNKITVAVKRKTTQKLFRLQNPQAKEKSLAVLTHNVRTFASLVVYVPNQLYYWLLSVSLTFFAVFKYRKEVGPVMIGLGIGFFLLCIAIIVIFQYLHYKKDLKFQKPLEKETEKEKFLVNYRDLIIKKNLISRYEKNYIRSLKKSRVAENKRDRIFTLAFVVPAYTLPKFASFLFLPFINNSQSYETANSLVALADDTKKMTERLRFYPFGLAAQKQINNFLAEKERDDIQKDILIKEPIESIVLKKVSFSYVENRPAFPKKVVQEFRKGKVNQLTGENGSGKSTVISLIMGLYQPNEGEILVNNKHKLSEINLVKWRKKIAYAEHENLVENGLSTGQKQLADLNTLFANSEKKEVFIFDEADNALDENNKKEFRRKIEKVSKKKLVILISH